MLGCVNGVFCSFLIGSDDIVTILHRWNCILHYPHDPIAESTFGTADGRPDHILDALASLCRTKVSVRMVARMSFTRMGSIAVTISSCVIRNVSL
jgi:hypothetical protein